MKLLGMFLLCITLSAYVFLIGYPSQFICDLLAISVISVGLIVILGGIKDEREKRTGIKRSL